MRLIEIKQYSSSYYTPKSKEDLKNEEKQKYRKRISYGPGLIDIDSIVTVEPIGKYDNETLEFSVEAYCIYFSNSGTRVCTDKEGYELIKNTAQIRDFYRL